MNSAHRSVFTIILALGFLSLVPVAAYADLVAGKVTPVPTNKKFSVKNLQGKVVKKSVTTDAKGNFEVTLRPGMYKAISDKGSATFRSSNRPLLGQVIKLK